MLIYLASPYTFKSEDTHVVKQMQRLRYKIIQSITVTLMNKGYVVFSPIVYGHNLSLDHSLPTDWNYWRKMLEMMVPRFDQLWVIKMAGWETSTGIKAEIEIAKTNSVPVKYFDTTNSLFQ